MSRAVGCSRLARRIAWRACRSASAVTAQVLTMTVSSRPAALASRRITSDSKALSRQPSVMTSIPGMGLSEQGGIENPGEAHGGGTGHEHVAVGAPLYLERSAVGDHGDPATREAAPRRCHCRGAGAGAAGDRDADPALPDAKAQPVFPCEACDPDVGALRKHRVMLELRSERRHVDRHS